LTDKEYSPQEIFADNKAPERSPRVIIAPHRYIQGDGVLDNLGRYMSVVHSTRPALLITDGGMKRVGDRIIQSLKEASSEPVVLFFSGECMDREVERLSGQLKDRPVDSLIAVGGGKCIDTGKCVAFCVSVPIVVCPTLVSTDAPCSSVSVMYTLDGEFDRPWFFPESPVLVVVDTGVIVRAPLRHLVSGMGDAMSTYYEARTCFLKSKGDNHGRSKTDCRRIINCGAGG
jgi:glycerol dehydrogenase